MMSGYQGNVLLVAETSDVFLYVSESLISFDGINDHWLHQRREMEENQNQEGWEREILSRNWFAGMD